MPHIEEKEKKEEAAKREKREQPRGSHLEEEEKKKIAKREFCVEKKIERRVQSVATFERDNLCVWEQKKNKRNFYLTMRHTQELL